MTTVRALAVGAAWPPCCGRSSSNSTWTIWPRRHPAADVSLNSNMLQFAAKFLDAKDPDEAKVKNLIVGIEGIYIRSFEFKKDGCGPRPISTRFAIS